MTKRIILHIGFPKTGTTTIQNVLYEHRNILLKEKNILYPALAPNLTDALCTIFLDDPRRHITNKINGVTDQKDIDLLIKRYKNTLEKDISSTKHDTLLLSAEGVSNLGMESLSKLKTWGGQFSNTWAVIAYVRHPVTYTTSVIQQLLKGGETLESLYQLPPIPNYKGKLSKFIRVFGKENISIFDFESATKENLLQSFCRQINVDDMVFNNNQDRKDNVSMSMEAILILDRINHIRPVFVNGKRNNLRTNQELAQVQRIKGNRFYVPTHIEALIKTKTRDDIEWLNKEFNLNLYNDVFLQSQPDELSSKNTKEYYGISDKAIDAIASIILELIDIKGYSKFKKLYNLYTDLIRGYFQHK